MGGTPAVPSLPTDVNYRTALGILLRLSQHLVRDRRCITFAKGNVLHQVREWIAFTPTKINVRQFAGFVSQKKKKRGDSVRDGSRLCTQYAERSDTFTVDLEYSGKL